MEAEEKKAAADKKKQEAEDKKRAAAEEKKRKEDEKKSADEKKTADASAATPNQTPPVAETPPPPPPAKEAAPSGAGSKRVAARSMEEAKSDPKFVRMSMQDDARVKITMTRSSYPYYGIPDNGCSSGPNFLDAELLTPFDGFAAGTPVVLRIEDVTIGPATPGASLAMSGLRRAGKGPDGTFVYCGRGTAFQIRR